VDRPREILTIGHSTRALDEFLGLLQIHGVTALADVRRFPASRRHPHFARAALADAVTAAGIHYHWLEGLGGRRSRRKDTPHTAWRVPAFAAYADHMETTEFAAAAAELGQIAGNRRTAILCAEALPTQCHRRLISDWLVVHGIAVTHILGFSRAEPHHLPDFLRVVGDRLLYDGGQTQLDL
jgi:uncharacterized protein (DUF488 family)